jgi:hypothetical protein
MSNAGAGNQLDPGSTGLNAAQLLQVLRVELQLTYFVVASTCPYNSGAWR